MNRTEFIEIFRGALAGKVPSTIIEDNARYYEEYINSQIRQGKTEAEVLQSLGDPRLLAKTIVEANKHAEHGSEYQYTESNAYNGDEDAQQPESRNLLEWFIGLPTWLRSVIGVLLGVVVVVVLVYALQLLLPIIFVVAIISFVIRLFHTQ